MFKFFYLLLVALVLFVAVALAIAATRPKVFRIERRASMRASPDQIVTELVDFHRWQAWSPWEKLDPKIQRTFSGTPIGVGSAYAWQGTGKVGAGRMEIRSVDPLKVTIQLDFLKPFKAHNVAEFTLAPQGDSTELAWVMHGPQPLIGRVMGLFFNMDKLIGKDFEAGLANLKAQVEKS